MGGHIIPNALLVALIYRSLFLLLPRTFFQPDEFYQALEPAHNLVFGYGHLTWEWRDLPSGGGGGWWDEVVVGGRMRSWLWPSIFMGVYQLLRILHLDETDLIVFAPRCIGVLVAALTDYYTYRLSIKVLGHGSAAGALFLSFTCLLNAHLLPRSLSTSPETLLTTIALNYFPLPRLVTPRAIVVGKGGLTASRNMQNRNMASKDEKARAEADENMDVVGYNTGNEINHSVMDRMSQAVDDEEQINENVPAAVTFATLAICIRPTTTPFWAYMGMELVLRTVRKQGVAVALSIVTIIVAASTSVLAASTILDYSITGRLMIPTLTFIHQNILRNISSFYGATNPLYHLTQSLPIMLFPIWWWWAQGFASCVSPSAILPKRLATLDRPDGLRCLARAISFAIATLSHSPHSEWRFLHPFLPPLILFALPPLFRSYNPDVTGLHRFIHSIRQYTRISKLPFFLCLLAPILPYAYLNALHGRAQVGVMDVLQRGDAGNVTGLVVLMPCHSTPWMSSLHRDIEGWFLTCEPPLGQAPGFDHTTQQDLFYASPVSYLQTVFPYPPVPLHETTTSLAMKTIPSHIILFSALLGQEEVLETGYKVSVREALGELGYEEVWRGWNGFDWAQDEAERRGGVRIWRLDEAVSI